MFNSIYKTKKSNDRDSEFGINFVHKDIMPDMGNNKRNIWDIFMDVINTYRRRVRNRFLYGNTTLIQANMYQTTISAKIALVFLAGWEAFMVQNVIVQWTITAFVLIGFVMWLYSYSLTIQKKNLILSNISAEEVKKWMKIAKNIRLQHDIDTIIVRCFVAACIFLILFIIHTNQN